jgi:predicted anti-sigma-YlaC factor YlaD
MQAMMWPILKIFGISCQVIHDLCSEQMDRKLTVGETLRLRIHLMMCGLCRNLPAQFEGLNALVRCVHSDEHEEESDECLSDEARERIASMLRKNKG